MYVDIYRSLPQPSNSTFVYPRLRIILLRMNAARAGRNAYRSEDAARERHRGAREGAPSPLLRLPLDLVVFARVEHELVGVPGRHARVALGPVVRDGVREYRARAVERRARHGAGGGLERCRGDQNLSTSANGRCGHV